MKPVRLDDLASRLGGTLYGDPAAEATGFATDNRHVRPGDVFLAIRGANVDGHDFVPQALAAGAVAAVVERPVEGPTILVSDLVEALAKFGAGFRDEFHGPVVGITGSAGKTTTKELVAAALSPRGPVLKTQGNRNTEYTAPLLWADLTPDHHAVVVEMAMRGFGQIAHLARFSRPTIGVVTNVGFAHLEMVESREGIARAKGELLEALPADGTAVLWEEDDFLETLRKIAGVRRVRTFGFDPEADSRVIRYAPIDWRSCRVEGMLNGEAWRATLPSVGRHLALNAAAAVLVATELGVSLPSAAAALESVQLPPMRMEILEFRGATVVLDTYNASPPSMIAAIETLREVPVEGRRRAVLGEMKELGEHVEDAHRQVGRALAQGGIDEICFIGRPMAWAREEAVAGGANPSSLVFAEDRAEVRNFLAATRPGDVMLVKGSRALELEKIVQEAG